MQDAEGKWQHVTQTIPEFDVSEWITDVSFYASRAHLHLYLGLTCDLVAKDGL